MSLEAIEKVTELETQMRERKAAAESEARQIAADAERDGIALLEKTRADAADRGRKLLKQAEERAAIRAKEIEAGAEAESFRQRQQAEARLKETAEFIVERVVKH